MRRPHGFCCAVWQNSALQAIVLDIVRQVQLHLRVDGDCDQPQDPDKPRQKRGSGQSQKADRCVHVIGVLPGGCALSQTRFGRAAASVFVACGSQQEPPKTFAQAGCVRVFFRTGMHVMHQTVSAVVVHVQQTCIAPDAQMPEPTIGIVPQLMGIRVADLTEIQPRSNHEQYLIAETQPVLP